MFQQLTIVGNLGADPEMRYMPDGTAVTNLRLATNRKWTDGSGNVREETTWFRVSVWGKQAEACNQYLAKGRQVLVVGRLKADDSGNPRTYQANDGSTRASFEVTAEQVKFLGGAGQQGQGAAGAGAPAQDDDDLPF